jgi:2'-5' RNA ligase
MTETVRSFLAVEVPAAVRSRLAAVVAGLGRTLPAVRWVSDGQLHLTLAFLGEVDATFLDSARRELAEVLPGVPGFAVRLSGLGAFPTTQRARVVWVGVDRGRDELVALQRSAVAALVRAGHVPEARPFSPHLTLGRLREPADASALGTVRLQSDEFRVEQVVLFRSVLRPSGPEYSKLAEFRLA